MLNRGLDKLELLRIVEAVADEKSIDKELVIGSMESAIQKAALTKFGNDNNIEVLIDRESGDIKIQKVLFDLLLSFLLHYDQHFYMKLSAESGVTSLNRLSTDWSIQPHHR